jgi:hypothetical protein
MKIFGIICQLRTKLFLIFIHRFPLVKAAMNAPRLCKLCKNFLSGTGYGAMVFTKRPNFLNFPIAKDGTKTIAHLLMVA